MDSFTTKSFFPASPTLLTSITEIRPDSRKGKNTSAEGKSPSVLLFSSSKSCEEAFTSLLPEGWRISGNITRVDPNTSGGSGNAMEARLYVIFSSPGCKTGISHMPDTRSFDLRGFSVQKQAAPAFLNEIIFNDLVRFPLIVPAYMMGKIVVSLTPPHAQKILTIALRNCSD
jgi:hypothetical protein